MWEFNLVVTMDREGRFGPMLKELALYGEFRRTEFFGVVLGRVQKPETFLETVLEKRGKQRTAFQDVGRVIPLDKVFTFRPEDFVELVGAAIVPYLPRLAGKRHYVRLERRGFKGVIVSPEAEQALDHLIAEELSRQGATASVDFENPEAVVAVETIGDRCGVGLLTRELLDRYPFVRVA
jgi:tRNA(Ser,Leu) C12 N-acetylase TAN1